MKFELQRKLSGITTSHNYSYKPHFIETNTHSPHRISIIEKTQSITTSHQSSHKPPNIDTYPPSPHKNSFSSKSMITMDVSIPSEIDSSWEHSTLPLTKFHSHTHFITSSSSPIISPNPISQRYIPVPLTKFHFQQYFILPVYLPPTLNPYVKTIYSPS